MDLVLYIHGKDGTAGERERFRPLFPGCEVVGLDYQTFTPWETGREIRDAARETTLFKGSDLYLLDTLDVGEYAYGPVLKRELIKLSLSPKG